MKYASHGAHKPPCKPIPLVIIVNEDMSCKIQYININIAILLNNIDKSRLILTALLSKSINIETTIIVKEKKKKSFGC